MKCRRLVIYDTNSINLTFFLTVTANLFTTDKRAFKSTTS